MKRVLLVVDDELEICRMIEKTLARSFDEIHTATTTAEAEPVLKTNTVTHLIVDLYLGKDEPLGNDLIQSWRARYSSIQFAALFTGSSVDDKPDYEGVDGFYRKPSELVDLINMVKDPGPAQAR
jgi:DNA-binding NtrC family response regulator